MKVLKRPKLKYPLGAINFDSRSLLIVGIGILAVALWIGIFAENGSDDGKISSKEDSAPIFSERKLSESNLKTKNREKSLSKGEKLNQLKKLWLELGPGKDNLKQRERLALESARQLLVSSELRELYEFLREQKISTGRSGLANALGSIFRSEGSAEARSSLIDNQALVGKYPFDRYLFIAAGQGCPEDSLSDFIRRVEIYSPARAKVILEGRNLGRMKTNPELAVRSTLEMFADDDRDEIEKRRVLDTLVNSTRIDSANCPNLIELLPPTSSPESTRATRSASCKIYEQWARQDLPTAASEAIKKNENLSTFISIAKAGLTNAGPTGGRKWIESLQDPHLKDRAALAAVQVWKRDHLPDAKMMVDMIADPKIKEFAQNNINSIEEYVRIHGRKPPH